MAVHSATILVIRRTRFAPEEFGPSFNDERHHLTIAGTSHLPWAWKSSPILQFGSARPFLPASGSNMLNLGGGSDGWRTGCDQAAPKNLLSGTQLTPVIDSVSNFQHRSGCIEVLLLGQLPACCHTAALRGDPYFDMDARLAKNIKLGEHRNLQLIFQAFNLSTTRTMGTISDSRPMNFDCQGLTATAERFDLHEPRRIHQPHEQHAAAGVHG